MVLAGGAAQLLRFPRPGQRLDPAGAQHNPTASMKLLCWNINSLAPTVRNCVLKWGSFKGLFEEYGADIMALQVLARVESSLVR